MTANILITGMSGTGKSTVIRELLSRGYTAIDTDSDDWCEWIETASGPDWVWRKDRMTRLLHDRHDDPLFVSGCKSNQGAFYGDFDQIVLLSASPDIVLERIATRTTNDYGKRDEEREEILGYLETVEPMLRRTATVEIDTGITPVGEVVDRLVALVASV